MTYFDLAAEYFEQFTATTPTSFKNDLQPRPTYSFLARDLIHSREFDAEAREIFGSDALADTAMVDVLYRVASLEVDDGDIVVIIDSLRITLALTPTTAILRSVARELRESA